MASPNALTVAIEHHQAGRLREAAAIYRELLEVDASNFDALNLLGIASFQMGNPSAALSLFDRALVVKPSAVEVYRNRAAVRKSLGKLNDAQEDFEAVISLNPTSAEAQNDLGIALAAQGRFGDAIACFKQAILANPTFATAYCNLGSAYRDQGHLPEAIEQYEKAISLDPEFGLAHAMLGAALQSSGHDAEALARYQEALAIDPQITGAHLGLGQMLYQQGLIDDALACFQSAFDLEPNNVSVRWALAISQLASVHTDIEEAAGSRDNFASALTDLDQWLDESRVREGAKAVGTEQPFFLAYQETDNREVLSRYGDLCVRLMRSWQEERRITPLPPGASEEIRVGVVSGQIRNHSVWHAIVKGWLQHVDRTRFSFHLFHTGTRQDKETSFARTHSSSFVQAPKSLPEWVDEIVAQRLDVLIFPEVGMDPNTLKLASMRLAPAQVAAWGHPETTGLPTIDYYLSAEDFEPPGAQDYYREKLVALPHLGCCYEALPVEPGEIDLDDLGIDTGSPILFCPGAPFKYAPRYDKVLVEIATRLKRCQFVFFHHHKQNLSDKLERRLEVAFDEAGLFFQAFGLFLPWQDRPAFYALMRKSDVWLDTVGFSGFNTAMQAVECGLPLVTWDGRFMRGRLASGILKRMGTPDLVAKSEQEYVDLAVRLASDESYNHEIRRRIEAQRGVLFNDLAPIRGFEEFLTSISKR